MLSQQLRESVQTASQVRPLLHQVKNLTPILCAIEKREANRLPVIGLQDALQIVDQTIDLVMNDVGLQAPGEEYQRAAFRNCIVPFAERDLLEHGSIYAKTWQEKISSTFRSISLTPGANEHTAKPALMVKLSIAENATRIISALSSRNIQNTPDTTRHFVNRIFADAKQMDTLLHPGNPAEKASLMSGMIKNYTSLMVSAIDSNHGQFDIKTVLQHYSEQQAIVLGLVQGSNELKAESPKTPSFLTPGH